jgi:hypothetical protein
MDGGDVQWMYVLMLSLYSMDIGIVIKRFDLAAVHSIRLCSRDWQSNELKVLPSS